MLNVILQWIIIFYTFLFNPRGVVWELLGTFKIVCKIILRPVAVI